MILYEVYERNINSARGIQEEALHWVGKGCDGEGMTPKGPLCKHFLQTIRMISVVWHDTLLTSIFQRLLVLENTILRIPRLDRWHNANHERGKNKACVFHLSQEVESAAVVNFSQI